MATLTDVFTGKDGEVAVDNTKIARITRWSFNGTASESSWGDSDGDGFTLRKPGRRDGSGSLEGKLDTDSEVYDLMKDGDEVELVLWLNATLYIHVGCAVITSFQIETDVDTEEVTGWSADFSTSGAYYYPGDGSAPSETYPG